MNFDYVLVAGAVLIVALEMLILYRVDDLYLKRRKEIDKRNAEEKEKT